MSEQQERDELAEVLAAAYGESPSSADDDAADHVLAAGYRKPRTLTTVEELEALPEHTVIRDAEPATMQFMDGRWWSVGSRLPWEADTIELPATVLFVPEASK